MTKKKIQKSRGIDLHFQKLPTDKLMHQLLHRNPTGLEEIFRKSALKFQYK